MSALDRRRFSAAVVAWVAVSRGAGAKIRRRPMFLRDVLASADEADVYAAPPGLTTRVALTPASLVQVVPPRRVTRGDAGWAPLHAALKAAAAGPAQGGSHEVRLGVVLKAGGRTVAAVFTAPPMAATVHAVVDDRAASAPRALAEAIAAAAR